MTMPTMLSPNDPTNPISSFEVGVITTQGTPAGLCLKFRHFDGSDTVTHWPLPGCDRLVKALLEYVEHGCHEQFMFRAKADPAFVATLPPRHPYHTLLSEIPAISESELCDLSLATLIKDSNFVDRGSTFVLKLDLANNETKDIYMHEYTAFSLYGYIVEYIKGFERLSGPTVGGIH